MLLGSKKKYLYCSQKKTTCRCGTDDHGTAKEVWFIVHIITVKPVSLLFYNHHNTAFQVAKEDTMS